MQRIDADRVFKEVCRIYEARTRGVAANHLSENFHSSQGIRWLPDWPLIFSAQSVIDFKVGRKKLGRNKSRRFHSERRKPAKPVIRELCPSQQFTWRSLGYPKAFRLVFTWPWPSICSAMNQLDGQPVEGFSVARQPSKEARTIAAGQPDDQ
jgi:hypothetical protein